MLDEPIKTEFMDLLSGSFLAAVFVWIWMSALGLLDLQQTAFQIQIALFIMQHIFFGIGSFTASYIVSRKTRCLDRVVGLKIGLGAWIISSTLFLPQSSNITITAVLTMSGSLRILDIG